MSLSTSYLARKLLILTQAPYLDAGVLRLTRVVYLTYINMIDCCVYVFTARWIILNLPTKTSNRAPGKQRLTCLAHGNSTHTTAEHVILGSLS